MYNLLAHLQTNPQEAIAITEGRAMPIGLSPKEILEVMKKLNFDKDSTVMRYWW